MMAVAAHELSLWLHSITKNLHSQTDNPQKWLDQATEPNRTYARRAFRQRDLSDFQNLTGFVLRKSYLSLPAQLT